MNRILSVICAILLAFGVLAQKKDYATTWEHTIELTPDSLLVDSIWYKAFSLTVFEADDKLSYKLWKEHFGERCEGVSKKKGMFMADCVPLLGILEGPRDVVAQAKETKDNNTILTVAMIYVEPDEARQNIQELAVELNKSVVVEQIDEVQDEHDEITKDLEKAQKDLEKAKKDLQDLDQAMREAQRDEREAEKDINDRRKDVKDLNEKYTKSGDADLLDKLIKRQKQLAKAEDKRANAKSEQDKVTRRTKDKENDIKKLEKKIEKLQEERVHKAHVLELFRNKYYSIQ